MQLRDKKFSYLTQLEGRSIFQSRVQWCVCSTVTHSDLQLEVRFLHQHICPDCRLFPWVPQELISATSVWIMWQFRTIISIFVRFFIPVNPWQRQFWTLTSMAPVMGGNKICWRPRTFTCVQKRFFSACNYVWKGVLADVQVQAFPPNVGVMLSEVCIPKQPSFFFSNPRLQTQLMYIWSCNDPHSPSIPPASTMIQSPNCHLTLWSIPPLLGCHVLYSGHLGSPHSSPSLSN